MIISPQSFDTNLSQLLAEVKSGSMQLPEFQRDWTWDDNRIRDVGQYRGYHASLCYDLSQTLSCKDDGL